MDLYTKLPEYDETREEMLHQSTTNLLALLAHLFGTTSVRALTQRDEMMLRSVLQEYGSCVASDVQNWYCREASKQATESSHNMLRAVLAGSAVKERELTGKEPDDWTRRMIEGAAKTEDPSGSKEST